MSDLISRQAILKHIEKIRQSVQMMDDIRRASIVMNGMYLCEKAVRNQPSAQPDITDEQAIEHLQSTGWMQNHDREMYDMGLKEQLSDDSGSYDSLLPSAQLEIIRCKDCKWSEPVNGYLLCGAWEAKAVDKNDFCSDGERREDG